jgi:septal ring factor EnvC (AmiA/AmiB activator)
LHKGKIVKPVNDKREEQRLSKELTTSKAENERLRVELAKAIKAFEVQRENAERAELGRERAIKTAEQHHAKAKQLESELGLFERTWFGYYKKT